MHQASSDPGRVGRALTRRGFVLDIRCPAIGHELPDTLADHAGVIVFGGPMSANDEHLHFIAMELEWVKMAARSGKKLLGICLGAQLLSRALGGSVKTHPDRAVEIGYWPITPTAHGVHLFDEGFTLFHWHREGMSCPDQATGLAYSDRFGCQAFQMRDDVFALQFHIELTSAMMNRWCVRGKIDVGFSGAQTRSQQLEARRLHDQELRAWLERFMDRWTERGVLRAAA